MGDPLVEQLQREGLPIYPLAPTNATKAAAIEALALAFEKGELEIIQDETLINELLAFEMDRKQIGKVMYSAPPGLHDDCVISAAIAFQGIRAAQPVGLW